MDLTKEVEVRVIDGVHVMYLNTRKNVFNPHFIKKIHEALDIVEACESKTALLTTSVTKNCFSYGLDLEYFQKGEDELAYMIK